MFYEEARELLIGLEEGLMDLERRQGDRAHLDKTFRAAHSLKGAAAMVGLRNIAEFTHGIEAVLDRIRAGTLGVDSDIISTLLEARDHLAAMVESEAALSPIPASSELSQRLNALLRGPGPAGGPAAVGPPSPSSSPAPASGPSAEPRAAPGAAPPPASARGAAAAPGASSPPAPDEAPEGRRAAEAAASGAASKPRTPRKKAPKRGRAPRANGLVPEEAAAKARPHAPNIYRVTLKPGPETLRRGINPLGVFDELRELGATQIETDPQEVPALDELDPERCYLTWTITVETDAGPDRIHEVFLFFTEDSLVSIERRTEQGEWVAVGAEAAPPL